MVDMAIPMSSRPAELQQHPVVLSWPVQWGDQDALGHVNNTIYFRWMESARIEYFRQAGLGHLMSNQGVGPILASIHCDFRRQLHFPDTILISASVSGIGRTSMKMVHRLYSTSQQVLAAEGSSVLVMFDYQQQRPVLVSDAIRAAVERLEGRGHGA
jgi:acyl-CoA thioester hydrolase